MFSATRPSRAPPGHPTSPPSPLSLSLHSDELRTIVLAGIAGLVAGALSMAVGEYISMSSQR